jgi:hypothetical protein
MKGELEENAVILCGHRKTGTTLLLALLEGHPELSVFPADSGFFYAYFPVYESPKYSNEDRINRIIEFSYGNLKEEIDNVDRENKLRFPFDTLYQKLREKANQGNYTSKEMLLAMVLAYRETHNASLSHKRWVEKTTSSEIYANYISGWFPGVRFIHLLRDPRDNYASLKSGWKAKYQGRADDIGRLSQSLIDRGKLGMELAKHNLERYGPDRYLVLKYEDLTADPKSVMKQIARFLGIEYDDCLLRPTVCGILWPGNSFDGLEFTSPSVVNVGRWRERITEEEAKLVEYHFRDIMQHFGYEPAFDINECIDAAVEHYKWYNYAQTIRV